jgi:hypothetical protein
LIARLKDCCALPSACLQDFSYLFGANLVDSSGAAISKSLCGRYSENSGKNCFQFVHGLAPLDYLPLGHDGACAYLEQFTSPSMMWSQPKGLYPLYIADTLGKVCRLAMYKLIPYWGFPLDRTVDFYRPKKPT